MPSYFWVALFPKPLESRFRALKEECFERFATRAALGPPGHISMPAEVPCNPADVEALHQLTAEHAAAAGPIQVFFKGFGAYPPKTIFVRVEPQDAFQAFWEPFRESLRTRFGFSAKHLDRKQVNPHATIAFRDLTPANFQAAWEDFKDREFTDSLLITSIHLFTRDERRRWVHAAEFPFLGKGLQKAQGTLF